MLLTNIKTERISGSFHPAMGWGFYVYSDQGTFSVSDDDIMASGYATARDIPKKCKVAVHTTNTTVILRFEKDGNLSDPPEPGYDEEPANTNPHEHESFVTKILSMSDEEAKAFTEKYLSFTKHFDEKEANIPDRTLSQFNAGSKGLAAEHVMSLNIILKKYGIKYKVEVN